MADGPVRSPAAASRQRVAEQAARRFERTYHSLARALAKRFGCPLGDAEDAVQTAYMRLLDHQLDEAENNVSSWLYTVAKHEMFHLLRGSRDEVLGELPELQDDDNLIDWLEARRVLALLPQLKPAQQECLRLRALGYSYREVCEHTGKTYTWVNRHTAEGRAALRKLAGRQPRF